jgi:NAD(P)H-dependent flavin oxidoreductase YrpB (nitropropane dioxygenase family)
MPLQGALISPLMNAAKERQDIQANAAGQGVGLINEIKPAARVVKDMVQEAEEILARFAVEGAYATK